MRHRLFHRFNDVLIRTVGLRLSRDYTVTRRIRDSLCHLKTYNFHPRVVIDVGVCDGTDWLYETLPHSHYILFEPQPDREARLQVLCRKYDAEYHMVALGASEGMLSLHLDQSRPGDTSPFLDTFAKLSPEKTAPTLVSVPMARMDQLLHIQQLQSSCLLKIDVQGYELEVLKGATRLLPSIQIVILETHVLSRYQGQPLLHEVVSWMAAYDFFLLDIADVHYRRRDGSLEVMDLFFASQSFLQAHISNQPGDVAE